MTQSPPKHESEEELEERIWSLLSVRDAKKLEANTTKSDAILPHFRADEEYAASVMQLIKQRELKARNYGRVASLQDLLTWLKLHDIEDVTMVQDYVEHVTTSVAQFPEQQHVSHPELESLLTKQGGEHGNRTE